ncbi:NUDIX hydrolase [Nocardia sp. alder85J]|uniref:NUDIX hydrolase n=1 Tax=Nocardia sp. alder85J TaxID=2862949 RepID=UPI001CD39CD3|nr:NUDIX domain-containing protein [Nocardia sp. alder85J]MCX4095798.1 NUDIX domain-containing protein [Nocardia sp. alder85J]
MQYTSFVDVHILLARDNGEILLARRADTGFADTLWNLPSGKLEEGEDLETAVIRETYEEVGVSLERDDVELVTTVHILPSNGSGARIGFFFRATAWPGEPHNAEPHKCSEIGWFPAGELPADMVPYSRAGIRQWIDGKPLGLLGWPRQ